MSKSRLHTVALALIGLVALAGAAAVFGLVLRQGPLSGATSHDFGLIVIEDLQEVREHTFELVNVGDRPIHVLNAHPSCGCTGVTMSERVVEPGATWALHTNFTLKGSGHKKAHIDLLLEIDGEEKAQVLWVEGVGRRRKSVWSADRVMRLRRGVDVSYRFVAERFDGDEEPAVPTLTVPEPLVASWVEWRRQRKASSSKQTPTIWQGVVRVLWPEDGEVPDDATLTIAVPTHPEFVVTLSTDPRPNRQPRPILPETPEDPPPDDR